MNTKQLYFLLIGILLLAGALRFSNINQKILPEPDDYYYLSILLLFENHRCQMHIQTNIFFGGSLIGRYQLNLSLSFTHTPTHPPTCTSLSLSVSLCHKYTSLYQSMPGILCLRQTLSLSLSIFWANVQGAHESNDLVQN